MKKITKKFLNPTKNFWGFAFYCFFIASCAKQESDFIGRYELINSSDKAIGKSDTLILYDGGEYRHILYSNIDMCTIYNHSGRWDYENGRLFLYNFRNDYYNSECSCSITENCYLENDVIFDPNKGVKLAYLYQVVNILEGIKYKRLPRRHAPCAE